MVQTEWEAILLLNKRNGCKFFKQGPRGMTKLGSQNFSGCFPNQNLIQQWTPFETGETTKGLVKGSGNKRPTWERSRGIRMIPRCAHLNVCGKRGPQGAGNDRRTPHRKNRETRLTLWTFTTHPYSPIGRGNRLRIYPVQVRIQLGVQKKTKKIKKKLFLRKIICIF